MILESPNDLIFQSLWYSHPGGLLVKPLQQLVGSRILDLGNCAQVLLFSTNFSLANVGKHWKKKQIKRKEGSCSKPVESGSEAEPVPQATALLTMGTVRPPGYSAIACALGLLAIGKLRSG